MIFQWFAARVNAISLFFQITGQAIKTSTNLISNICIAAKKVRLQLLLFCIFLLFPATSVQAILLNDWLFNVDGQISDSLYGDPIPTTGTLDDGLGTLSIEITGRGAHNVIGFFDYEILRSANTWWNEYGVVNNAPGAGQSWEIDEPGLVFGDIVDNALAGALDNTNAVPFGWDDDVSFAMGWEFSLMEGDTATINYVFSEELTTDDFYLAQVDPDASYEFYFYSELNIETAGGPPGPDPSPAPIPEPSTAMLMLTGLLMAWTQRQRVPGFGNRIAAESGEKPYLRL
jgi:hypothetical protein